ncbi:MAG: BMP family ABC transporter substrate-binding protein [Anaerolineae bacterium]|nr:BMP family ABC transporter substrate-binding protein [Anaerolineae bacterium]
MRKNLFVSLLVLLTIVLVLSACGGATPTATEKPATDAPTEVVTEAPTEPAATEEAPTEEAAGCAIRIGYVTDVGRIDDDSFNEASWTGIQQAAEQLGLGDDCYDYIETQDTADYVSNIEAFVKEGYTIIVTSGFLITEGTRTAAESNPDIKFVGTDQGQDVDYDGVDDVIPNLTGILFHEDQSGFLAGALAGLMTESNTIGGVYGTNTVPPVVRFKVGYELGAKHVNPDITVLSAYHPGTSDVAFVDPAWGGETAQTMIDQGADVIFGAGGDTGNGALTAACNAGLPVIGVDVDQYLTVPEVQACIMSSAQKDLVTAVRDNVLAAAGEGEWTPGTFYGKAFLAPFHDWEDKIPDDVKATLEDLAEQILAGEIVTCPPGSEGAGCPE